MIVLKMSMLLWEQLFSHVQVVKATHSGPLAVLSKAAESTDLNKNIVSGCVSGQYFCALAARPLLIQGLIFPISAPVLLSGESLPFLFGCGVQV